MQVQPTILPYRPLPVADRWTIHAYYTLSPYAPDGSGRILAAGADLDRGMGDVLVLDSDGQVLDRFGNEATNAAFWHTGWWQTWSPDARYVYYQAGSLKEPAIVRRELATGHEIRIPGDMEGAPPTGEPVVGCLMSLLYAAGYGTMVFDPSLAPVPFAARDRTACSSTLSSHRAAGWCSPSRTCSIVTRSGTACGRWTRRSTAG